VGVITMALLAGCTVKGTPFYPGAPRPVSETALLQGEIHRIDDRVVRDHAEPLWGSKYGAFFVGWEVLPGPHTIVAWSTYPDAPKWLPEFTLQFEAKPGLWYRVGYGPNDPPRIMEFPREVPLRGGVPVGRVVGRAPTFPDSTEVSSDTWTVTVASAVRSMDAKHAPKPPGNYLTRGMKTLGVRTRLVTLEEGIEGHFPKRGGYILQIGIRLRYRGPEPDVPAPTLWLIGSGGLVIQMIAYVSVPLGVGPEPTREEGERALELSEWILSGAQISPDVRTSGKLGSPRSLRLRPGEGFDDAVLWYYFQVPEFVSPDQLRLAFADLPPLRLPPIGVTR
jgi:hypothetical protein